MSDRDAIRNRVVRRIKELGLNYSIVSRRMGRNQAYIADYINKHIPAELGEKPRAALARILQMDESELRGPRTQEQLVAVSEILEGAAPRATAMGEEGQRIEPGQAPPEIQQTLERLGHGEVWRIVTQAIDGMGYLPGDYLVIDLDRQARVGDAVLAMHDRRPIFRLFQPPWLMEVRNAPVLPPAQPIYVENTRTIIRGVCLAMLRVNAS